MPWPDRHLLESTYGAGVSVADVLSGKVPPAPELQPLYDFLSEKVTGWPQSWHQLSGERFATEQ
jgi:hypothetical protein